MIQIALILLGGFLVVIGFKGLGPEGIWLSNAKQIEGRAAKIAGIATIVGGVLVVAYALFILPRR